MGKILLFYKYTDIQYPKQIQKWQSQLCQELKLKGRIIIAHEGINGTVGGLHENIEIYKTHMLNHELFNDIDLKESPGDSSCFPKLRIVVRSEIVTLGIDPKIISYKTAGKHLKPEQAHKLIDQNPKDLVILDARNNYESHVGLFKGAKLAEIKNFRDFPKYIDSNIEQFKDKQVLMYCTGGIRCERASAYLKSKNVAKEVLQIEGGIARYIEKYPDGFFRGKNYIFDNRVTLQVNEDILGKCYICNSAYDGYVNCLNAACNKHIISCPNCIKILENTCSKNCHDLVKANKVKIRPPLKAMLNQAA